MITLATIVTLFFVASLIAYYYYQYPEMRQLHGLASIWAAVYCVLIGILNLPKTSKLIVTAQQTIMAMGLLLFAYGAFKLLQDLAKRRIVRTALFDPESNLPNRGQWARWLRKHDHDIRQGAWWVIYVSFLEIKTVRRVNKLTMEKSFFNWLGSSSYEVRDQIPGYLARTSIQDIGVLLPADSETLALQKVSSLMQGLEKYFRNGGFSVRYQVHSAKQEFHEKILQQPLTSQSSHAGSTPPEVQQSDTTEL